MLTRAGCESMQAGEWYQQMQIHGHAFEARGYDDYDDDDEHEFDAWEHQGGCAYYDDYNYDDDDDDERGACDFTQCR